MRRPGPLPGGGQAALALAGVALLCALVGCRRAAPPPAASRPPAAPAVTEQWQDCSGNWTGVCTVSPGAHPLGVRDNAVCELAKIGRTVPLFTPTVQRALVCAAELAGGSPQEVIVYGAWGESVAAYDRAGAQLWRWQGPARFVIEDVQCGDLDGDAMDEVVVLGMLGKAVVLDHTGARRSFVADTVRTLAVLPGAAGEVARLAWDSESTSPVIREADGALRELPRHGVAISRVDGFRGSGGAARLAFASRSGIQCVSDQGDLLWTSAMDTWGRHRFEADPAGRYGATVDADCVVRVVDLDSGACSEAGTIPEAIATKVQIAWVPQGEGYDLLIAGGGLLRRWTVTVQP